LILRKLGDALRKQDWVTVGIEVLVVIVGLLLGLQIDRWSEDQANVDLGQEYLERLYGDLVGTLEDHDINANWDRDRICSQEVVLGALREGRLSEESRERFEAGLVWVGVHNPIRRRWGTIEELKSTGTMSLLDLEVRNRIAAVEASYGRADRIVSVRQGQLTQLRARLMSYFEPLSYTFGIPATASARYDFDALANDPEFIALFANAHMESSMVIAFVQLHMEDDITGLRDLVAERLGIVSDPPRPLADC